MNNQVFMVFLSKRKCFTWTVLVVVYCLSYYIWSRLLAGKTYEKGGATYFQFFKDYTDWEPAFRRTFYPLVKIDQIAFNRIHDNDQYLPIIAPSRSDIERLLIHQLKEIMKDPAKLRTVLSMENRRPLLESQDFLNLLREKGEIELLKYLEEAVANLPAEPLEKGG